jgi:hypothetical protein
LGTQGSGILGNGYELEEITGEGGKILGKRRLHLCLGCCRGDLNNDFVLVVYQVDGFYIRFDSIQIVQLPSEQIIEEMQVKILGMEMKIKEVQLAANLDSGRKLRKFFFDIIEKV